MTDSLNIPAVRDKYLNKLLQHFDIDIAADHPQVECYHCGRRISPENVGAFVIRAQRLVVFCNTTECLDYAVKMAEELR